jgi:hypothetical protein
VTGGIPLGGRQQLQDDLGPPSTPGAAPATLAVTGELGENLPGTSDDIAGRIPEMS